MKKYICLNIFFLCLFAFASPAFAGKRKVKVVQGQYTNITLPSGKSAACMDNKPGKIKRNKKGTFFINTAGSDKKKLKRLKDALRRASGKAKKQAKNRFKKHKRDMKLKGRMCRLGFTNPDQDPKQAFKALKGRLSERQVRVLLERAGFGYTARRESAILSAGLSSGAKAAVDELFKIRGEDAGLQPLVDDWLDGRLENDDEDTRRNEFYGMRTGWLLRLLHTNNAFREKLALNMWLLWGADEDSLNSSERDYMWEYINTVRDFAYNPDFRAFVQQVSLTPLMLRWLGNQHNVRGRISEHFASTYLTTFMMGEEGYLRGDFTDSDVTAVAKAFTGWQLVGFENPDDPEGPEILRPFYVSTKHEPGTKILFGGTPYQCGARADEDAHACLFDHPGVSNHYARHFLKAYLTDEPSEDLIVAFAAVIREKDFRFDDALRVLFESETFHTRFVNQATKNPIEASVEFVRTLGVPVDMSRFRDHMDRLHMNLTDPKYPGHYARESWMSQHHLLNFRRYGLYWLEYSSSFFEEEGWTPQKILPEGEVFAWDIVAYAARKMNVELTDDSHTQIKFYLNHYIDYSTSEYRRSLYDNILESHQWGKGRYLYRLLGMTPDFMMK